jgi:hypothetical protein
MIWIKCMRTYGGMIFAIAASRQLWWPMTHDVYSWRDSKRRWNFQGDDQTNAPRCFTGEIHSSDRIGGIGVTLAPDLIMIWPKASCLILSSTKTHIWIYLGLTSKNRWFMVFSLTCGLDHIHLSPNLGSKVAPLHAVVSLGDRMIFQRNLFFCFEGAMADSNNSIWYREYMEYTIYFSFYYILSYISSEIHC